VRSFCLTTLDISPLNIQTMDAIVSIRQFVQQYATMRAQEDNLDAEDEDNQWSYLKSPCFALTGHDGVRQHIVNPLQNRFDGARDRPTMKRDYDSLIGFTPSIPVDSDIVIFPVSSDRDVLAENIHLKVQFRLPNVRGSQILGGCVSLTALE
jgi:hypothetical protein